MKLCIDCIHHEAIFYPAIENLTMGETYHYCRRNKEPIIDPVTGEKSPPWTLFCRDERMGTGGCGPNGRFFLSKPPSACQVCGQPSPDLHRQYLSGGKDRWRCQSCIASSAEATAHGYAYPTDTQPHEPATGFSNTPIFPKPNPGLIDLFINFLKGK